MAVLINIIAITINSIMNFFDTIIGITTCDNDQITCDANEGNCDIDL